jgi:hypothetical protein
MKISRQIVISVLLSSLFLSSCHSKQDGAIEGAVLPPGRSAHITAVWDEKDIRTISADMQDGKFKLLLAPGVYTINVSVADSPFPLHVNNIMIKSGETTELPPIELTTPSGTGGLSGQIIPPRPDVEIKLIYEGKERAAIYADREGKYEFKEVPAGEYVVQANAPGHADDSITVVITDNQKTEQNAILLPIVAIDGVDWASGKIHATGYGMTPQNASNGTVRREMAKRAALADAQRNMLNTIAQIRIDNDQTVKTAMRSKNVAFKIEGFLKGFTIVSEWERENGKFEVILELPLAGPAGLTRYIIE